MTESDFAELLWADLGNEPRLEVCANITELCCRQCRELPYWLRAMLQVSPASLRLFTAEMDRRGWKRHVIESKDSLELAARRFFGHGCSISARCPRCGWEAFPSEAPKGPDCGGIAVINPIGELALAS